MAIDEPLENTMSIDELRREVRNLWNRELALNHDLRDLPAVPSFETMRAICNAAMGTRQPDVFEMGKLLQREHSGLVPHKAEYECATGLWSLMRAGILAARTAPANEAVGASNDQASTVSSEWNAAIEAAATLLDPLLAVAPNLTTEQALEGIARAIRDLRKTDAAPVDGSELELIEKAIEAHHHTYVRQPSTTSQHVEHSTREQPVPPSPSYPPCRRAGSSSARLPMRRVPRPSACAPPISRGHGRARLSRAASID